MIVAGTHADLLGGKLSKLVAVQKVMPLDITRHVCLNYSP